MKPWTLAIAFPLGVLCGLYAAHEAQQESERYAQQQYEATLLERDLARQQLHEAEQVLEVQQALLAKQLKVLEDICPVVRRAAIGWPWCPPTTPKSIVEEEDWKR